MFEIFMIIGGALMRIIPHAPNFAPIAAIALFGGVYLNKRYAIVLPLIAMLISDFFIGFHDTMIYVYGAFILTGLIGIYLRKHKSFGNVVLASFTSSILFFLITNFGVWVQGMYARDISGLWQSYVMGLPFFRNTLIGDLFYVGVFFGAYELALWLVNSNTKARNSKQIQRTKIQNSKTF